MLQCTIFNTSSLMFFLGVSEQDFYNMLKHDNSESLSLNAQGLSRLAARRLAVTQSADLAQVMNGPIREKLGIIPSNIRSNFLLTSIKNCLFKKYESNVQGFCKSLLSLVWGVKMGSLCNALLKCDCHRSLMFCLLACSWSESSGVVFNALGEDFMKDTINEVILWSLHYSFHSSCVANYGRFPEVLTYTLHNMYCVV